MYNVRVLVPNPKGGYDPQYIQCNNGIDISDNYGSGPITIGISPSYVSNNAFMLKGMIGPDFISTGPEGSVLMVKNGVPQWTFPEEFVETHLTSLLDNPIIRDRIENVIKAKTALEDAKRNLDMTVKLCT